MPGRQLEDSTDRAPSALRYVDVLVLALALPVFLAAGLPMLGYAVCAGAWIVQRSIQHFSEARAEQSLRAGNRRGAMGLIAGSTMGRVWLVTIAILLVGKLGEREDGLAAAVLTFVLVTAYFIGLGITKLLEPEHQPAREVAT